MANSRNAKLYIDDTGAVGDGTYEEVTSVISSDAVSKWRLTEEQCRGDSEITFSPDIKEFEIPCTIKFVKGSTIQQRVLAAFEAGTEVGIQCSTGDTTASAGNAGNLVLTMNAICEEFTVTKQAGNMIEVRCMFKPHADNTDSSIPDITIVAAS